jgi:uncharacterized protein (TIGR00369 family)
MNEHDGRPKVLHEVMGMELLPAEAGTARARMAVTHTVCQPFGYLSGGASLALAETLAGYRSLALCQEGEVPLGVQVSASHVHAVPLGGVVFAEARILSQTRALHVWNVDITDEEGRIVSTSRVTNCIKKRKSA